MRLAVALALVLLPQVFSVSAADHGRVIIDFKPAPFSKNLTQQSVKQSFQDSTGSLWFVTQEGLNRYTGHELENYRSSETNTESLSTDNISSIVEDLDGKIWISTVGGGLNKYDAIKNSFSALRADANDRNTPYSHYLDCE